MAVAICEPTITIPCEHYERIKLEWNGHFSLMPGSGQTFVFGTIICIPPPSDKPPGANQRLEIPGDISIFVNQRLEFHASARSLIDLYWAQTRDGESRSEALKALNRLTRYLPLLAAKADTTAAADASKAIAEAYSMAMKRHIGHSLAHPLALREYDSLGFRWDCKDPADVDYLEMDLQYVEVQSLC